MKNLVFRQSTEFFVLEIRDRMDLAEFYGKGDVNLHLSQIDGYLTAPKVPDKQYHNLVLNLFGQLVL